MEDQNQQENKGESVAIPEIVVEQLRESAKERMRKAVHSWKQKGGYIKCSSCDYPHAFRVTPDKRMVGIDTNGMPVFDTGR